MGAGDAHLGSQADSLAESARGSPAERIMHIHLGLNLDIMAVAPTVFQVTREKDLGNVLQPGIVRLGLHREVCTNPYAKRGCRSSEGFGSLDANPWRERSPQLLPR